MNINMTIQKTFAMIKPDAVRRGLIGKIISRIEEDGFEIVQMRKCRLSSGFAAKLYRDTENQLTNMGKKTIESMTNAGKKEEIRTRLLRDKIYTFLQTRRSKISLFQRGLFLSRILPHQKHV